MTTQRLSPWLLPEQERRLIAWLRSSETSCGTEIRDEAAATILRLRTQLNQCQRRRDMYRREMERCREQHNQRVAAVRRMLRRVAGRG